MKTVSLALPGMILIEPQIFRDDRGHFLESWNEGRYEKAGIVGRFIQDNVSWSRRGVLRGLHFQEPHPQAKLVSVLHGEVWDVAVDIRLGSETFGKWMGMRLSAENGRQLYIPEGFAHGFVVLSEAALFSYKCTDYYHPEAEAAIRWDDPDLAVEWPVAEPFLSGKDRQGMLLRDVPADRLPQLALAQP